MGWNKNRERLHEAAFSSVKAISNKKDLTSSTGLSQRPPIEKNIIIVCSVQLWVELLRS